jgi:hypothetical protein
MSDAMAPLAAETSRASPAIDMQDRRRMLRWSVLTLPGALLLGCNNDIKLHGPQYVKPAREGQLLTLSCESSSPIRITVRLWRSDDGGNQFTAIDAAVVVGSHRLDFTIGPLDYSRDHGAHFKCSWEAPGYSGYRGDPIRLEVQRLTGIDIEPADATSAIGGQAVFRVVAHGEDLAYSWQIDGAAQSHVPVLDGPELRIDGLTADDDGSTVRVDIHGANGDAVSRIALLQVSKLDPVVFADSDFVDADWSLEVRTAGKGGSANGQQQASGGNLDRWHASGINVLAAAPDSPAAVYALHWRASAVYDPRSLGAAASIDYREDQRRDAGDGQQSSALLARQAGHVYFAAASAVEASAWTTQSANSMAAGDFELLFGTDPGRAIDLTASADAIEFGFLRACNVGAGMPAIAAIAGIDNWSVTIWR